MVWVSTCADTKLVPTWMVGNRGARAALAHTDDLAPRLSNCVQITSDGHRAYLDAVDMSFGGKVNYTMLIKIFGETPNAGPDRKYSPPECIGTQSDAPHDPGDAAGVKKAALGNERRGEVAESLGGGSGAKLDRLFLRSVQFGKLFPGSLQSASHPLDIV